MTSPSSALISKRTTHNFVFDLLQTRLINAVVNGQASYHFDMASFMNNVSATPHVHPSIGFFMASFMNNVSAMFTHQLAF